MAGVTALKKIDKVTKEGKLLYERRRNIFIEGLNRSGWKVSGPKATFYVWARVPGRYTSASFAEKLLREADIVVTPGNGFGMAGEGYVRMALTVDESRLKEAAKRIAKVI